MSSKDGKVTAASGLIRPKFSSLRTRTFTAFTLLFLVIFILLHVVERYGLPFSPFEGLHSERQSEAFRTLTLTADMKKERLTRLFKEYEDDVRVMASNLVVREKVFSYYDEITDILGADEIRESLQKKMTSSPSYLALRQYIDTIKNTYSNYERVDIFNISTGTILVSSNQTDLGSDIFREAEDLEYNLPSRGFTMSVSSISDENSFHIHSAFPIARPGNYSFEEPSDIALLLHINSADFIAPFLHTGDGLGETGEALLINRDVKILSNLKYPLPDGTIAKPMDYQITAEPARRAARGEEGIINIEDYRGVPVLAAYRYIPISTDEGWGMVVKRDEAEIFRTFRQSEFQVLLIGVISILLTIIIATILSDNLTRPILNLSRTAQLVEQGNLDVRAQVEGTSEIKMLAEGLNSMLQRLQDWTTELDNQVKARTAELDEKNQELEQIVYVTSHDLRSPLVNIHGFSRVLEEACFELKDLIAEGRSADQTEEQIRKIIDTEMQEALEYIFSSVKKMDLLIKGLLKLSRLGKTSLEIKQLDMDHMMKEIAKSFEFQLNSSGANLEIEDLPPAMGDADQINQVFSNLIDNAIKYLDDERKGLIKMTANRENNAVTFCVEDNGTGFSQEYAGRAFEIFHRLDPDRGEGDGLGLTIVQKIVEKHGGKIWAESTPGVGSMFYVSLRAADSGQVEVT